MEDGRPAPGYRRIVAEPLIQVGHRAGSSRDIGAVTSRFGHWTARLVCLSKQVLPRIGKQSADLHSTAESGRGALERADREGPVS